MLGMKKKHLDDFALKNLSFDWKILCKFFSYLFPLEDNIFDNFSLYIRCLNLRDVWQRQYIYYITTTKTVMVTLKMMMTMTTLTLTFGINFLSFFSLKKILAMENNYFSYYQKCSKTCNFWCMFKIPPANFDEDRNYLLNEAEKKLCQRKFHLFSKDFLKIIWRNGIKKDNCLLKAKTTRCQIKTKNLQGEAPFWRKKKSLLKS